MVSKSCMADERSNRPMRGIQNKMTSYQLEIYAKSNHSNFTQRKNRGFIRVCYD